LSANDAELLDRVRRRLADPTRPPAALGMPGDLPNPAATREEIAAFERRAGIPLPPLLRALLMIADGSFGPGYGLLGVAHPDSSGKLDLSRAQEPFARHAHWPAKHFVICQWGCGGFSVVDASSAEATVLYFDQDELLIATQRKRAWLRPQRPSLHVFVDAWLADVDLYAETLR
jgi:hypothetical protein